MDEIYVKEFIALRNTFYDSYIDVRNRALDKANCFLSMHTGYKVLNIIEEWNADKTVLTLIVYYC